MRNSATGSRLRPIAVLAPMRHWLCASILLFACADEKQPAPPDAPGAFPGHEPPALDELLTTATGSDGPAGSDIPYDPQPVAVPPIEPIELSLLPRDDEGRPVVSESESMALVVDETLADPITAKGDCLTLVSGCIQPIQIAGGRTIDSCFASAPRCTGNQPWGQGEECCHARCLDLYAALRRQDYSQLQAFELTARSLCFPSVSEFLEAAP